MDWTDSGRNPLAHTCECGNELSGYTEVRIFLTSLIIISIPIASQRHGANDSVTVFIFLEL
jgi:hypothetical protein